MAPSWSRIGIGQAHARISKFGSRAIHSRESAAPDYQRLHVSPPAVSKSRRGIGCQRVFCRSHFFQAASEPLKTLMSDLPVMPGTMPVPVYCQKVKG